MAEKKKETPVADAAGVNPEELTATQAETIQNDEPATERTIDDQLQDIPVDGQEVKTFNYKGKEYGLSDRMPEKLKFYGEVFSKEEVLTNEEVMSALIAGNSPFIKKV